MSNIKNFCAAMLITGRDTMKKLLLGLALILSFSLTAAKASNVSVTVIPLTSAWGVNGFFGSVYGQTASPATTSNGYTYQSFNDTVSCVWGPCGAPYTQISITGFTSNPGQGWLTSVTALGVTKYGSAASFGYAPSTGTASWVWAGQVFGFGTSGTATVSIVHN